MRLIDISRQLQQGLGAKLLWAALLILLVALWSGFLATQRFGGLPGEAPIEEALLARQIAEGKGFTTPVRYAGSVTPYEERTGDSYTGRTDLPDLHHAPFYPLVLASGLFALPDSLVFVDQTASPGFSGMYRADLYVLLVNMGFLWVAAGLTAWLAGRLFGVRGAWVAGIGFLLTTAFWEHALQAGGISLLMVIVLALFHLLLGLERERRREEGARRGRLLLFGLGLGFACACAFLTEYTAGLLVLVVGLYAGLYLRGRALGWTLGVAVLVFIFCAAPWMIRNIYWTGHPMGLAVQELALRGTAEEPASYAVKAAFDEVPEVSIRQLTAKGWSGVRENFTGRLWQGGAFLFVALFVVSLLYAFRRDEVNALRWTAVGAFLLLGLLQPFFDSGESLRWAFHYLGPLAIVFGTGFFFVLLESVRRRPGWEMFAFTAALLVLQGVSMLGLALRAPTLPFQYPPYYPPIFQGLRESFAARVMPTFGLMSDVPAGVAWYGRFPVWAQPPAYADFNRIGVQQQDIFALVLTRNVLDRPYFTELAEADKPFVESERRRSWSDVYVGIAKENLPFHFALNEVQATPVGVYILYRSAGR